MTDLHVDDGTVQSAGIVAGWFFGIGAAIYAMTLGPMVSWARKVSARLAAVEKKCRECPAELRASRTAEIDAAKKEMRGEIGEVAERLERRFDKQDTDLHMRLDNMQHAILTALGVQVARGQAD